MYIIPLFAVISRWYLVAGGVVQYGYRSIHIDTVITSAQNSTIKRLRQLATSSKARRDANTYLAEGIHLVRSFLTTGQVPTSVVCANSALDNDEVAQLVREIQSTSAQQVIVADSLFESFTSIHASVGILILFSPPKPKEVASLTQAAMLLEDVQDPGNLGTMLRTAAAVGIGDVFLSSGCASPWSPKALRAGMGAQFSLLVHEQTDLARCMDESTIPTLVTTLSTQSKSLFEVDLTKPVAWVFGSEGQGVSQHLLDRATTHVLIPQIDSPVESLNVAAAAAVCLYEQYRQSSEKRGA